MPYKDKEKQKEAQRRYNEKRKGTRHHSWNAVGYPESMPSDWLDTLRDSPCQGFVSPLHDRDVNPDGELKKPHYHIIISFANPVTYEVAQEVFGRVSAVMPPKNPAKWQAKPWVIDLRQELRYFLHLDNPNKAQYDAKDVVTWGGVDFLGLIASSVEDDEAISEIMEFCDKYDVASYARLCQYVRDYRPEWKRVVFRAGAVTISRYLRSVSWGREHGWVLAGDNLGEIAPDMEPTFGDDEEADEETANGEAQSG